MKAIVYAKYGGPEVLEIREVEPPTPAEDEVLIRTKSVSLNPYDWHYMRGEPRFMRLSEGLFTPKVNILGNDVAGVVEAVGSKVTQFSVGDEVTGSSKLRGLAELVSIKEENVAHKPKSMSMAEAASLNIAGITALESVRKFAQVKAGESVLVNGGSGGVGHYAIQIAKADGAEVTAVCSTRNLEMVRDLGADHVIDYTKSNVVDGTKYDKVIDTIGNFTVKQCNALCKKDGMIAVVGFGGMGKLLSAMLRSNYGKPKLKMVTIQESGELLRKLCDLVDAGKLRTVIDRDYPFAKTAEAIDYLEQGHARGKVVVSF